MTNPELAEVLASYVPKLIQKRVAADPSPIESPVTEEIQAAVLFADISGFTRLTETLAEAGPALLALRTLPISSTNTLDN